MNSSPRDHRHPAIDPAARNVAAIAEMERSALHQRSFADRLSDRISHVTGSVRFAVVHAFLFAAWIIVNTGGFEPIAPFDPYPFSFLTLVVSLEAIFLSVFVLMSQNRMTRHADKRAHLDLQVDLLAEQELTAILQMLRALCIKHNVKVSMPSERVRQMLKDTDVHTLATELDDQLPEE